MDVLNDPEQLRLTGDEDLTPEAVVYEVLVQDERHPEYPQRYRLDLTFPDAIELTVDQPSPLWEDHPESIMLDLDTLERLGQLATALKATRPDQ